MTPQRPAPQSPRTGAGFTLIEIAVGLFIITLVIGALLVPLSQQVESRKFSDTQRTLDLAVEALLGFAAANGRLPCPASAASNGVEDPVGGGNCNFALNGFLPAATLGLSPTDANGYLVDAWSSTQALSRIRYAVTEAQTTTLDGLCNLGVNVFTTTNGMRNCWAAITRPPTAVPPGPYVVSNLIVCSTSNAGFGLITATACPPPPVGGTTTLTTNAIAVIYSVGANAATTSGIGADEAANPNPGGGTVDRTFVWHLPSAAAAPNGEFDDVMIWISPNVLYSKLIASGQLP